MISAMLYNFWNIGSLYFSVIVNSAILFLKEVATWLG